jgi:HSP20 family protein
LISALQLLINNDYETLNKIHLTSNKMSLAFWNPVNIFAGFDDHGIPATLTRCKDDTMRHSSPRFEITENDRQFRLAVDVPGMKPDNLKVELEDDGRVLHMHGERKVKSDKSYEEFKFDKRFKLGRNVDKSKITAHLSDGVLVLTAPKMENLPPATQPIAIAQGEAPSLLDVDEEKKSGEIVDKEKKSDEMEA